MAVLFVYCGNVSAEEIIWVCPTNYGNDLMYKFIGNVVYKRKNKKWINLHTGKTYDGEIVPEYKFQKIVKENKIIFHGSYEENDVYGTTVYDLKEVTIKTYITPKDHSEPSKLEFTNICKEQ